MGWTWEVSKWVRDETTGTGQRYKYKHCWGGEFLLKAIWVMQKLKRDGVRCIKLEWRPR